MKSIALIVKDVCECLGLPTGIALVRQGRSGAVWGHQRVSKWCHRAYKGYLGVFAHKLPSILQLRLFFATLA